MLTLWVFFSKINLGILTPLVHLMISTLNFPRIKITLSVRQSYVLYRNLYANGNEQMFVCNFSTLYRNVLM